MFCSNCGKQLGPGTNFCPACGTRTAGEQVGETWNAYQGAPSGSSSHTGAAGQARTYADPSSRPFLRPRSPRLLGGVCAAFAQHYGWSLDLVRVLTAVFALFYGVGILAYIACWIIIPEEQYALPSQSR